MTLIEFNTSIRNLIVFYTEVGLWYQTIFQSSLPRSEEFNKISLTSMDYNEIFECGLSLSHYNFNLHDLAYFHFTYTDEHNFALAYYPNPRLSGSTEALSEYAELIQLRDEGSFTDEEFAALASEMPARLYVPRIRFEYSEKQYRNVRHPGAHFHIGMSGEDRWCSARQISPKSFGLLIAKMYYPKIWWAGSRFAKPESEQNTKANLESCFDEMLLSTIRGDGVSQFLADYERLTFHFGALQPA